MIGRDEGPGSHPPARGFGLAAKDDQQVATGSFAIRIHKGLVVTVPGHPGKDIPAGTLKAILRSAGLERKEGD